MNQVLNRFRDELEENDDNDGSGDGDNEEDSDNTNNRACSFNMEGWLLTMGITQRQPSGSGRLHRRRNWVTKMIVQASGSGSDAAMELAILGDCDKDN
jgi:hypothetical protein